METTLTVLRDQLNELERHAIQQDTANQARRKPVTQAQDLFDNILNRLQEFFAAESVL